jgi:hypothetical protein
MTSLDDPPSDDLRPDQVSPELALVDPELARRLRERHDAERASLPTERPVTLRTVAAVHRAPPPARPQRALRIAFGVLALVAVGAVAAVAATPRLREALGLSREHAAAVRADATATPLRTASTGATTAGATRTATTPFATTRAAAPHARPAARRRPLTPGRRVFAWTSVPKATYYVIDFYRGRRRIYEGRTVEPKLALAARWKFDGRRYALTPGRYRWSVRAGFGRRSARRYGKVLVDAKLVVSASR